MNRLMILAVIISILLAPGCATIIHGSRQTVNITSNPPGVVARVDGAEVVTPNSVSLSRSKDHIVNFEKAGCQKGQVYIGRSFNGVATILGNILWLPSGFLLDVMLGGAWTLEPDQVSVTLACQQ